MDSRRVDGAQRHLSEARGHPQVGVLDRLGGRPARGPTRRRRPTPRASPPPGPARCRSGRCCRPTTRRDAAASRLREDPAERRGVLLLDHVDERGRTASSPLWAIRRRWTAGSPLVEQREVVAPAQLAEHALAAPSTSRGGSLEDGRRRPVDLVGDRCRRRRRRAVRPARGRRRRWTSGSAPCASPSRATLRTSICRWRSTNDCQVDARGRHQGRRVVPSLVVEDLRLPQRVVAVEDDDTVGHAQETTEGVCNAVFVDQALTLGDSAGMIGDSPWKPTALEVGTGPGEGPRTRRICIRTPSPGMG